LATDSEPSLVLPLRVGEGGEHGAEDALPDAAMRARVCSVVPAIVAPQSLHRLLHGPLGLRGRVVKRARYVDATVLAHHADAVRFDHDGRGENGVLYHRPPFLGLLHVGHRVTPPCRT